MKKQHKNFFHIEPSQGLLNDPNGLIHFKGTYYFFHQWNRFNTNHDYKEWGLFTSENLVQWESRGTAILPDRYDDKDGIYSGSAIEKDNRIYLFYTGNTRMDGVRKSYQKIAVSTDGMTFVKQEGSIETPEGFSEHHRDPKVWRKGDDWWMIVGAQTTENVGAITFFQSKDLLQWEYQGLFYSDPVLDQMCECPDYFSLTDEVDILTVCPQKRTHYAGTDAALSSYAGYLVGKMDYAEKSFTPHGPLQKLDHGFDFYAPQSFEDEKGRRIMVAWMSRMEEEEEKGCPTTQEGYLHCLTMPRELQWRNGKLFQIPLEEYQTLRKKKQVLYSVEGSINNQCAAYEIILDFKEDIREFSLTLNSGANTIHFSEEHFQISRINWVTQKQEMRQIKLEQLNKIHVFADRSTLEVFLNDGEYVFSLRNFCDTPDRDVSYQKLNPKGTVTFYQY